MSDPRERSQPIASLVSFLLACLLLGGIANAAPSISLSKRFGPPTSKILVSGRGFEPNVGVDILFDTKNKALVVTNGSGEFHHARIFAPRGALPGTHWVTALERNNDKGAQKPFLVQTNWSQFHFDADGTRLNPYENVLNRRTVNDLDLKWSYMTNAPVQSSPAVVDGVVYFNSDNVYALDAGTGAILWSYATGFPGVDGVVYVGSTDNNFYALNASTGALLWTYLTGSGGSSPAVANGVVYVGGNNVVYALNASTGTKLWSYSAYGGVASPAVVNGVVYVGSDYGKVYALNARTGRRLWSYTTGNSVVSSPAVASGVVYIGSDDYNLYALNAITGALLWKYNTGGGVYGSPALSNGVVYVGSWDNTVYALNASTGAKLWRYNAGSVASSPAVANGLVYVGSYDGNVYALDANSGSLLWRYPIGAVYFSSPAVANGLVYVGSYDYHVYAFGHTQ